MNTNTLTDEEVLKLFRGMSESMQKAIIDVMKVTQVSNSKETRG